jgi:sodium-dependent dicarboxylate transporter 2/3/5
MNVYKKKGFIFGLIVFISIMFFVPTPSGLDDNAWLVAGVVTLMAIWWATEAIPVPVTALLPLALFPILGITTFKEAAQPYANPNIYLFLGGFMLALAIERSGLHKRMALHIIIRSGSSGSKLIAGFMIIAALISMFVMNTSTTLMLLPIGLAVCSVISSTIPNLTDKEIQLFDTSLMLGIAYAATIGGMSTLVGTAPNIVFSAFMQETYGIEISMIQWMTLGVPLAIVMLFSAWVILTKYVFPTSFITSAETRLHLQNMLEKEGPLSKDEKKISIIFGLTALAWMFRTVLDNYDIFSGLTDAGIAIISAILLFMIPSSSAKGELLNWSQSDKLPWGLLILFGGGLSIAAQINSSGLGIWIGEGLSVLSSVPPIFLILAVAALIIFLTEVTSNVATTSTFLPVFGAVAIGIGVLPVSLTVPVCLAASCAFMLPVATPPNAIVYGSGKFTIATMMRAGFFLNIIGIFVVTLFAYYIAPMIF